MPTTPCRDCDREVSTTALQCPKCGAPQPYDPEWNGWGYEYKLHATFLDLPLVHVSFKYKPNRMPVVARGWLAIGQFSYGFINISQFGAGPIAISQFSIVAVACSQACAAAA